MELIFGMVWTMFWFLVGEKEELSDILNRQNNELFDDVFLKNDFF